MKRYHDKAGSYYNVKDVIDILKDTREFLMFDQVVAIEIIEHIDDYRAFLRMLTRFEKRDKHGATIPNDPTEYFAGSLMQRTSKRREINYG